LVKSGIPNHSFFLDRFIAGFTQGAVKQPNVFC